MAYKTILALCDSSKTAPSGMKLACRLAERHGSLLVGLHICSRFEPPMLHQTGCSAS